MLDWQDLIRLAQDEDSSVRRRAAFALRNAFSQVLDHEIIQAWQDLHRLTRDKSSSVKRSAAGAIGNAFSHLPDKTQAWQDLIRLTQDKDNVVRMNTYHSLGRASVLKATEAKDYDTLKRELKAAIGYFEKSSQMKSISNPARFCYPFYRTYFAIAFQEAKYDEVQKYLAESKEAVGGSECKEELLRAVENLANALKESQCLKERSKHEIANELNAYRWYCEKAAEHMRSAEDKAPGAVKLMRKCSPLLEEQIQANIAEIQVKAKQICQITRGAGTDYENIGTEINTAAKLLLTKDIYSTQRCTSRIISQLKELCKLLPEGKNDLVCGAVEEIGLATEFPDKLGKIELALTYVRSAVEAALQSQTTIEIVLNALEKNRDTDQQFKELLDRLDALASELQHKRIADPAMKKDVDKVVSYVKDAELDVKHRLEYAIPIIPGLLTYKGVTELGSGLKLLAT